MNNPKKDFQSLINNMKKTNNDIKSQLMKMNKELLSIEKELQFDFLESRSMKNMVSDDIYVYVCIINQYVCTTTGRKRKNEIV